MSTIGLFKAAPPADLRPFVQALVERSDSAALGVAIELPDPSPLFQFVLGGDYEMRRHGADAAFATVPHSALWGPTSAVWEARALGPAHIYCVVLTHLGAAMFGQIDVGAFAEQRIDIRDLHVADIGAELRDAPDFVARTALVIDWLRAAAAAARQPRGNGLALASAIVNGRLVGSVEKIARQLGISTRALHKKLVVASGWAPKRLLRLVRLQAVLRQIHPQPWDIAATDDARLHFHDDSHFVRDFKQLTTLTPAAYRTAKLANRDCLINTLYAHERPG